MQSAKKSFVIFLSVVVALAFIMPLWAFAEPKQAVSLLEELQEGVQDLPLEGEEGGQPLPSLPEDGDQALVVPEDTAAAAANTQTLGIEALGEEAGTKDAAGDFEITGGDEGDDYEYDGTEKVLTIKTSTSLTISGSPTTDRIVVTAVTANLTLDNLNAQMSDVFSPLTVKPGATLNLTLSGTTTLTGGVGMAGLNVPKEATLNINGTGTLKATGGAGTKMGGAGIGGNHREDAGTVHIFEDVVDTKISGGTVEALGAASGTSSNPYCGAGIGGGSEGDGGTVNIFGGTVKAEGGNTEPGKMTGKGGAGIGGGSISAEGDLPYKGGSGGNVTISGGMVTAIGGGYSGVNDAGASIGGGAYAGNSGVSGKSKGNLYIDGGSIKRTGSAQQEAQAKRPGLVDVPLYRTTLTLLNDGEPVANIKLSKFIFDGTGDTYYSVKDVETDAEGKLYFWLDELRGTKSLTVGTGEESSYIEYIKSGFTDGVGNKDHNLIKPDLTVTGGTLGTDYDYADNVFTIKTDTALKISGTTTRDRIVVAKATTANLTIEDLNIDVKDIEIGTGANANDRKRVSAIKLDVDIPPNNGATLNLTLSGTNTLKGGYNAAGIEVPSSATLTIAEAPERGSLESLSSKGGGYGAGIGGSPGTKKNCGTIIINSGTILAWSGYGAGIGGGNGDSASSGSGGSGGIITINGGEVTAKGDIAGAGIGGGGQGGKGGNVTINGGVVKATGDYSSGIGGGSGNYGAGGEVTITGGTVIATSLKNGAGIGGGSNLDGHGGDVIISGGTVVATSRGTGAGIGAGGYSGTLPRTLEITGGSVWRTGNADKEAQATSSDTRAAINLYPVEFTFTDGTTALSTATLVTAQTGLGNYGLNDVYTEEGTGKVCFYLPENSTPTTVSATAGSTYTSVTDAVTVANEYPCDTNTYNLYRTNHEPVNPPNPDTPISLDDNLTIVVNGSLDSLASIKLGGVDLPLADIANGFRYILWPGQTGRYCGEVREGENGTIQIILYKEYLATLKNGTFTLMLGFTDTFNGDTVESTTEVKFTIKHDTPNPGPVPPGPAPNPSPTPNTGDGLDLTVLAFLIAASLAAVITSSAQRFTQPLKATTTRTRSSSRAQAGAHAKPQKSTAAASVSKPKRKSPAKAKTSLKKKS